MQCSFPSVAVQNILISGFFILTFSACSPYKIILSNSVLPSIYFEQRIKKLDKEEASFQKQYLDSGTAKGKFEPQSLKEHWNSDYMKDIRKRMLAGEAIPQCVVCNENVLNLHTYRKYFTDKNNNAVLRLSRDGITEISNYGMKDFFRDQLTALDTGNVDTVGVKPGNLFGFRTPES